MKYSMILPIAALAQVTIANFDIFRVNVPQGNGVTDYGYQIFASDPSCAEVKFTPWYGAKSDLSGKTTGVRCNGFGCSDNNDAGGVDEMEMHFSNSPLYHWTIYKNRSFQLIGLDGKSYGNCIVFPGLTYSCEGSNGGHTDFGFRKFRCLTSVTADQIHAARA